MLNKKNYFVCLLPYPISYLYLKMEEKKIAKKISENIKLYFELIKFHLVPNI